MQRKRICNKIIYVTCIIETGNYSVYSNTTAGFLYSNLSVRRKLVKLIQLASSYRESRYSYRSGRTLWVLVILFMLRECETTIHAPCRQLSGN